MDVKSSINLERLLEQVIILNPTLKDSPEQLPLLNKKLEDQLVQGEAVVQIETMAFDPLRESIERRINQLKCNLSTNQGRERGKNEKIAEKSIKDKKNIKFEEFLSDSSDEEALILKKSRSQASKEVSNQTEENVSRGGDSVSEMMEVIPLSLQRTPRKRKRSSNFKYELNSPIKSGRNSRAESKYHRKKHRKQESAVSTSAIIHHCEEDIVVERGNTSRSFCIKVPSLFKRSFHELDISDLSMTRKVIGALAQDAKKKILQNEKKCLSQNKKKLNKKKEAIAIADLPDANFRQERDDAEISQLINDVIGTSGNEDETWQATNALQNINNDIMNNYEVLPCRNSPQEFLGFENGKALKCRYKSSKPPSNEQPKKKRGRKPKIKDLFVSQPPTKSNLAQYVENFSNDMRGSTTPAASSTMSQPLVSSTTQNYENGRSPVVYYLDGSGNWENGDPCHLVTTNGLSLDAAQLQSNDATMTVPYGETTLDGNMNLPIITQLSHLPQTTNVHHSTISPIINIQIPPISTTTATISSCNTTPPPAHTTAGVLDLSLKSNLNISNTSTTESINYNIQQEVPIEYQISIDNDYMEEEEVALDLSVNATSNRNIAFASLSEHHDAVLSESQCIVLDDGQDDDFIRRLIETSDFDLGLDQLQSGNDDSKSFKAALDMPLLETIDGVRDGVSKDVTISLQNDSTYASMNEESSNFLSCTLGEDYHFADQSTKEIFHQLLEIDDAKTENTTDNNDRNEAENMGKIAILSSDEVTFCGNKSTQIETDNATDNDKKKANCQQENSDTMMKQTEVTSTKDRVHLKATCAEDNSGENTNNNPTPVMKSTPRILKRRHTPSINIASPKVEEIATNDTRKIVSFESPNKKEDSISTNTSKELFNTSNREETPKEPECQIVTNDANTFSAMDSATVTSTNVTREVKQVVMSKENVRSDQSITKVSSVETANISSEKTRNFKNVKDLEEAKNIDEVKEHVEANCIGDVDYSVESIHIDESKDLDEANYHDEAITIDEEARDIDKVIGQEEGIDVDEGEDLIKAMTEDEVNLSEEPIDIDEGKVLDATKDLDGELIGHNDEFISNYESSKPAMRWTSLQNETTVSCQTEGSNNTTTSNVTIDVNQKEEHIKSDLGKKENSDETKKRREAKPLDNAKSHDEVNDFDQEKCLMETNDTNEVQNDDDEFVSEHDNTMSTSKSLQRERSVSCEADSSTFQNFRTDKNLNNSLENPVIDLCVPLDLKDSTNHEYISKDQDTVPTLASTDIAHLQNEASVSCVADSEIQQSLNASEHVGITDENLIINLCMPLNLKDHKLNSESKDFCNDQDEDGRYSSNNLNTNNFERTIESSESDNTSFAKREKVVFSIAKIKLNDETTSLDYMFLSDSDNNSQKSSDEITQCNVEIKTEMQSEADDLSIRTKSTDLNNKEEANTFPTLIVSDSEEEYGCVNVIEEDEGDSWSKAFTNENLITNEVLDVEIPEVSTNKCERQKEYSHNSSEDYPQEKESSGERNENKKSDNSNSTTIPELNMSLLEMESKLEENTLNFEEDDDLDALVLDTSSSCFDSPNDDRFKESLVNESDINTNANAPLVPTAAPTNTTNNNIKVDVPKLPSIDNIIRMNVTKPPSAQVLMNFKIPKLKISGLTNPTEKQTNEPTGAKPITCANVPNIYDVKMQPSVRLERIPIGVGSRINIKDYNEMIKTSGIVVNPTKFEKVTRTITNASAATPAVTSKIGIQKQQQQSPIPLPITNKIGTQQPHLQIQQHFKSTFNNIVPLVVSREQHQPLTSRFNNGHSGGGRQTLVSNGIHEIANIFGITCLPYLVNKCHVPTHCKKSHQFNDNDVVFSTLNSLNKPDLYEAYSFMIRHSMLYIRFFVVFCNLYSVRNDRHKLLNMINDCGRYPEHAEFLIILYDALVNCGFSPPNACRQLLTRTRHTSTPIIDALVAIIMKSDWTMFSDYIERFAHDINKYHFRIETLEQMAPAILNGKQLQLKDVFYKCLLTAQLSEFLSSCSPSLLKCVNQMATTGNAQH